jgi:Patatin phospholipase
MREHWQSGLDDTRRTLKRRDWLALPEAGMGIVVHDVHRERTIEALYPEHLRDRRITITTRLRTLPLSQTCFEALAILCSR